MPVVTVEDAGLLTTVQDRGRPGYASLGVPPSGALDARSLQLANRLVGNDPDCAGLEITFGGLTLTTDSRVTMAITGAGAPVWVDRTPAPLYRALLLEPNQSIRVGRPTLGVRNYLAISGGIEAEQVFGSASCDILSELGPAPLVQGDKLHIAQPVGQVPWHDAPALVSHANPVHVRVHKGPRAHWFREGTFEGLGKTPYTVSSSSNRIGIRLHGPKLHRAITRELYSEGIVTGAVEVPPDGQPLIFLADHPTTGGYPVIAVVDPVDLPRLAQAGTGDVIRFMPANAVHTRNPWSREKHHHD